MRFLQDRISVDDAKKLVLEDLKNRVVIVPEDEDRAVFVRALCELMAEEKDKVKAKKIFQYGVRIGVFAKQQPSG